jgi:tRNA(Arg) A34 adenosine deaminase TadA
MRKAIEEARISLGEGNSGFGAVVLMEDSLIARARDAEKTDRDPTAHAEITAIRMAAAKLGRDLSGCILVATHEPCPMCAAAALWSGISEIAYGFSIKEAIRQHRKRIDISCREIFKRAGKQLLVHHGVLHSECSVLYDAAVRDEIDRLRGSDRARLEGLADALSASRLKWYSDNQSHLNIDGQDVINSAYQLFTAKLGISEKDAPVISRDDKKLILHSRNFCPTLEACKILNLDTRFVCRHLTEKPTTDLLRRLHPKLRFTRNYDRLRPYAPYCEEMIILDD